MRILITGVSGFVGGALALRLRDGGHEDLHGLARDPTRVDPGLTGVSLHQGDAVSGAGLDAALDGVQVAYYLIHSMEAGAADFGARELRAAERFGAAAAAAGVGRIVYLGGLVPPAGPISAHLSSRRAVERTLKQAVPDSVVLRSSIVIGARSRSFRFLVRLVERLPVLALPAWRGHRTQPIDERDMLDYLIAAATEPTVGGQTLDIAGPDTLSYAAMIERIAELMLVRRPPVRLGFSLTPVASAVAAKIAGEDPALTGPLMRSLEGDLLADDAAARARLKVRLHGYDAAVEHALGEWERHEPLRAR